MREFRTFGGAAALATLALSLAAVLVRFAEMVLASRPPKVADIKTRISRLFGPPKPDT